MRHAGTVRMSYPAVTPSNMGMDLYAGILTRCYVHNRKAKARQWAEANGGGYRKISPESNPEEEMS